MFRSSPRKQNVWKYAVLGNRDAIDKSKHSVVACVFSKGPNYVLKKAVVRPVMGGEAMFPCRDGTTGIWKLWQMYDDGG